MQDSPSHSRALLTVTALVLLHSAASAQSFFVNLGTDPVTGVDRGSACRIAPVQRPTGFVMPSSDGANAIRRYVGWLSYSLPDLAADGDQLDVVGVWMARRRMIEPNSRQVGSDIASPLAIAASRPLPLPTGRCSDLEPQPICLSTSRVRSRTSRSVQRRSGAPVPRRNPWRRWKSPDDAKGPRSPMCPLASRTLGSFAHRSRMRAASPTAFASASLPRFPSDWTDSTPPTGRTRWPRLRGRRAASCEWRAAPRGRHWTMDR